MKNSKPAASQQEAISLINNTMDAVEDAYSGVKKAQGIPNRGDGRMYGILDDKFVTILEDGTKIANTKGNRVVLEKDGSITNAAMVQGLTAEQDKEVLRVINNLRHFYPGMHNGKPVRVQLSIPIDFKMITA